jgi:hypothetical protein
MRSQGGRLSGVQFQIVDPKNLASEILFRNSDPCQIFSRRRNDAGCSSEGPVNCYWLFQEEILSDICRFHIIKWWVIKNEKHLG